MTPRGQESFKFEEEPPPIESVERDECQYCGNLYASEGSCVHCMAREEKLDYLKTLEKKAPLTEFEAEVARLKKVRPNLADNKRALAELANINISARKPSKFKPPEDPNYH
jgi:hypothetical protein